MVRLWSVLPGQRAETNTNNRVSKPTATGQEQNTRPQMSMVPSPSTSAVAQISHCRRQHRSCVSLDQKLFQFPELCPSCVYDTTACGVYPMNPAPFASHSQEAADWGKHDQILVYKAGGRDFLTSRPPAQCLSGGPVLDLKLINRRIALRSDAPP